VHGAPLRVVVPGYIGARSVKWLERIELRSDPWAGYFQRVVYRLLAADEVPAPDRGIALGLIALNSAVLAPADGATVAAGAGHGQRLRVCRRRPVGAAGRRFGRPRAQLGTGRAPRGPRPLGVAQWQITLTLEPGEHELVVRAWDSSAATQPEDEAALWNPKGYVNNARPRIRVRAVVGDRVRALSRVPERAGTGPSRHLANPTCPSGRGGLADQG